MRKSVRTMSIGAFKAQCIKVIDDVAATRQPLVITKNGKPLARLEPSQPSLLGYMAGTIKINGDIISPIDIAWDAEA